MVERQIERTRETEAKFPEFYEITHKIMAESRRRAQEGKVVISGKEMPFQQCRQGRAKQFLHTAMTDTALEGWHVFVQDVKTHSGKHRHQGGLCIFVIEGRGWTVVDGVRYDWEAGDLLLLPLKPEGVEHQHFNAEPGAACRWLAFIFKPFWDALGNVMEQKENHPDWKGYTTQG